MTAVSVIVASYNSRSSIGRCLDSLYPQLGPAVEVLVADSSVDGTAEFLAEQYPWVRVLHSNDRWFPGAARNYAIGEASGGIFAFIDADCIAAPDWIARAVDAQQRWGPVVGGGVDNANPRDRSGWIYYLCEFAAWLPEQPAGWMDEIPTCCLTVDRKVLARTGPFREHGYCSDTAFHWKLKALGIRARFDPELRVAHLNPTRLGRVLRKMSMHGEHFARARCEERRLGRPAVLLLWLGSPALPVLLLVRRARQIMRTGHYRAELLRALPGFAAALTAWSFGEWRGYGQRLWRGSGAPGA